MPPEDLFMSSGASLVAVTLPPNSSNSLPHIVDQLTSAATSGHPPRLARPRPEKRVRRSDSAS